MNSGQGFVTTGYDMERILLITAITLFTLYMITTAVEDFKSCQVTRWKHLIGFGAALICLFLFFYKQTLMSLAFVLLFALLFIVFGLCRVYGLADGFVLANLTLLFGSMGGLSGVALVVFIVMTASISMLLNHMVYSIVKKKKRFTNRETAFVPHIFVGYLAVLVLLVR